MIHSLPVRVYYEDTDAGGVVYYANYLKYAERGRSELLRQIGFENTALLKKFDVLVVVKNLESDYRKPARLDDALILQTQVMQTRPVSVTMSQRVFRGDMIICDMKVTLVCVTIEGKPTRWPDDFKSALDALQTDVKE